MEISGKKLADSMKKVLKKQVKNLKKTKLKLVTFLVGQSADQISFVKIKRKLARDLGIDFEFVHLKTTPAFEKFMRRVKEKAIEKETSGVIIQQPLPAHLSTESIYNCIPLNKEIEGHLHKTTFYPPIGLAILTLIKHIFSKAKSGDDLFINLKKDRLFLKKALHSKKIVLIGRGITGGHPIGKTLSDFKINYFSINSHTPEPESYFKEADLIISAVGKKVIKPESLKPGVILINVGLRREGGKLKGDYEVKEIKKIASFYTPTIGGIGPLDVLYLYKNLIDAHNLQQ